MSSVRPEAGRRPGRRPPTRIVVTGGAGYIGACVVRALVRDGHEVVVIDDLSTGDARRLPEHVRLVRGDIGDPESFRGAAVDRRPDAVVHLAARKAVDESVREPLWYYDENVSKWRLLLAEIVRTGVPRVLLSSSAAVYGSAVAARDGLVDEAAPPAPESPYGRTKLAAEWLLEDVARAAGLSWTALRYFNVAGAVAPWLHDSHGTNLLPRLFEAVAQHRPCEVYGDAYPTRDGSCVRDYVHVADVADAHAAVLRAMAAPESATAPGGEVFNIGTGRGVSVLEMVAAVRRVTGFPLEHRVVAPRAGDPPSVVANPAHIAARLGWRARYDLDEIVGSAWGAKQAEG